MRTAVRAIVIKDGQLLVMHRNKFGEEYETLPGGNIELGEKPEEALLRELDEETQVIVQNPRYVFLEHAGEPYGDQYIYLCDYVSGEPQLRPGSEEDVINQMGKNLYRPMWVKLEDLVNQPMVSERLKAAVLKGVAEGWPETCLELN